MSTNWEVYCFDCKEEHNGLDQNPCPRFIFALIRQREIFEKFEEIYKEPSLNQLEIGWNGLINHKIESKWFLKHKSHKLVGRSEYGQIHLVDRIDIEPIYTWIS